MQVTPLTTSLGAIVTDIDLAAGLNASMLAQLRAAWLEHLVLFIRGPALTPSQLLAFARQIGEPDTYPFLQGLKDYPEITEVLKKADETINFGGVWHSDTTYQAQPPMATMLYAIELPPTGGDTLFANQYHAYETLSPGLRQILDQLHALAQAGNSAVAATRKPRIDDQGTGTDADALAAEHPVVRVHPETGRRSLFLSPAHASAFAGWSESDSEALLQYLFKHQISEEFCCRHQWQKNDIALWDNRCTLHYPVNDYDGHQRLLHRITLKGDIPVGPAAT